VGGGGVFGTRQAKKFWKKRPCPFLGSLLPVKNLKVGGQRGGRKSDCHSRKTAVFDRVGFQWAGLKSPTAGRQDEKKSGEHPAGGGDGYCRSGGQSRARGEKCASLGSKAKGTSKKGPKARKTTGNEWGTRPLIDPGLKKHSFEKNGDQRKGNKEA